MGLKYVPFDIPLKNKFLEGFCHFLGTKRGHPFFSVIWVLNSKICGGSRRVLRGQNNHTKLSILFLEPVQNLVVSRCSINRNIVSRNPRFPEHPQNRVFRVQFSAPEPRLGPQWTSKTGIIVLFLTNDSFVVDTKCKGIQNFSNRMSFPIFVREAKPLNFFTNLIFYVLKTCLEFRAIFELAKIYLRVCCSARCKLHAKAGSEFPVSPF